MFNLQDGLAQAQVSDTGAKLYANEDCDLYATPWQQRRFMSGVVGMVLTGSMTILSVSHEVCMYLIIVYICVGMRTFACMFARSMLLSSTRIA